MTAFRSTIQQQGRRTAERIVAPLARLGVTPNGLTAVGLLLNILAGLLLAWQAYIPGALMVLVAGAFDMLDGALARVSNRKTVFGGFFDSTIDRYSEAVVFLGLQVAFLRDATAGGAGRRRGRLVRLGRGRPVLRGGHQLPPDLLHPGPGRGRWPQLRGGLAAAPGADHHPRPGAPPAPPGAPDRPRRPGHPDPDHRAAADAPRAAPDRRAGWPRGRGCCEGQRAGRDEDG